MTDEQIRDLNLKLHRFHSRHSWLPIFKLAGLFAAAIALGFFLAK